MLSVFLGILVATLLLSAAPVYLDALERQSVKGAIAQEISRWGDSFFDITVESRFVPLDGDELVRSDGAHDVAVEEHATPIVTGVHSFMRTLHFYVWVVRQPDESADTGDPEVETGLLQHLEGLEDHVTLVEGRATHDVVLSGADGPVLEVVVSATTADHFGDIEIDDILVFAPSVDSSSRVSAKVVGIVAASDPDDPYWRNRAGEFLSPRIPDGQGIVTEDSPPLLAVFVGRHSLIDAMRTAFPAATLDMTWYNRVDTEILPTWSRDEMRDRMRSLRRAIGVSVPDSTLRSGIDIIVVQLGRRSFLNSIPLLLLLALMGAAVIYFLFMIVSYLVPNRESDVALIRSRGATTSMLLKLYLIEGLILTVPAAATAPLIALPLVWLAGMLPYFAHVTGGNTLPVYLSWAPFAAAAVAGLLCLLIFVVPGVVGARAGLNIQKLRASRPPSVPLVQQYYIDFMILAVAGVLYWELHARGELVSGGLFGQQDVNEALLIAPVLFLLAIGMLFFRVFPMFIRLLAGESLALVHSTAVVTLAVLIPAVALAGLQAEDSSSWISDALMLGAFGAAYWLTAKLTGWRGKTLFTVMQAVIASVYLSGSPPHPDMPAVVFAGSIALAVLVPAQIAFYLLTLFARRAPVWVSLSMWHMGRTPVQYSWLVLLLVLGGGIGIVATTVGATLDRSYEERIRYNIGSDIHVTGFINTYTLTDEELEDKYGSMQGVESISAAFRGHARVGVGEGGPNFQILAVDTDTFQTWFRGDFSQRTVQQVVSGLRVENQVRTIPIPEGATRIQMWVNGATFYPLVFLWVVVEDANGRMETLSLGELDDLGWRLMSADLPDADSLARPLKLVSVQLNEPGYGATGRIGQVFFDGIQAVIGETGEEVLLEGFEEPLDWFTLPTKSVGADELARTSEVVHSGSYAASFSFGKETNMGIRGLYRSGGSGFIPAVASSSFVETTGASPGSGLLIRLTGGIAPVMISDVVDYFPTLDPAGMGFLVFDMESLLGYMDTLNPLGETAINEFFVNTGGQDSIEVLHEVDELLGNHGAATGVEAELAALDVDPLVSAGWRTLVLIALAVVLFISGLGYVVYLLAYSDRSVGEMASLRTLGLNRFQAIALVAFENLLVAFTGLGLGTWAGFHLSRLIVSSVAVTDGGGRVLPPYILTTNWPFMGALYCTLMVIFLISLMTLGRRLLRVDLNWLSRMEGQ